MVLLLGCDMSSLRGKNILLGPDGATSVLARLWVAVRGVAFWIAALLPLAYFPLLYLVPTNPASFVKLMIINGVALVVGHGYYDSGDGGDAQEETDETSAEVDDEAGRELDEDGTDTGEGTDDDTPELDDRRGIELAN